MQPFPIILLLAAVGNLAVGGFVITSDHRQRLNQLFFIFSFLVGIWVLVNFMTGISHNLFWIESAYSLGCLSTTFALLWFLNLCEIKVSSFWRSLIIIFGVFFFLIPYFSDYIVANVKDVYLGGYDGGTGGAFPYFASYVLLMLGSIFYVVVKSYIRSTDVRKMQLRYIMIGAIIWVTIIAIVSFFLPFIGYLQLTALDSPTSLIFITLTAFAIVKHHLFNIKVIVTELLVFSLWFFILFRTLIAENIQESFINGGLLVLTVIIGIFLIRSVIKEVSLREHIELLATDLQKANDRLTELDRQKSEFVSFATHQLRAPLTAMKGYASLILEGDMGAITAETKQAITRIFDSTKTLASIVDDYLNITRIELGSMKYSFDTIDMKSMVSDVIGELKPNIDAKPEIKFTFEADNGVTDFQTTADRDKLKQVIANLIDNSIKYTPKGWVKVTLTRDASSPMIVFKVQDNGIGIDPEVLPHLFAKFSRAPGANKVNIKGTGLGLFVAKEIVNAHHGKLYAESLGEGKGSTFVLELEPFAKA